MRYLDSSVVLSEILAEGKRPPGEFWTESLVSSRLLTVEVWTRLQAYCAWESHAELARKVLGGIEIVEMEFAVLLRAHEPFPRPLRALDAIHLSTADFLRDHGQVVEIATYDARMRETALVMGFPLCALN
ncbi:MAG TPA: PIN domain-containing protein [Gemmatimonadota bacterium]|nr:PIN domain-containing protein [Gemmatimonadota bacterium]